MSSITIPDQIKSKRIEFKWSQQKLAEVAKLSIDTIRAIETGRNTNPTLYVIKQLQSALQITFEI